MPMDLARVLQEAGVTPDPAAGRAFRYAAAAMAMSGDPQDRRRWGREAVDALAGLASAKCDAELRALLTPDPVNQNVTWTVACYQVGDLAPSAVRDFSEPSDAIATLAACPDPSHVAAELVASTQFGLRWTALVRTNDQRAFQLPSAETASDASHTHGAELADALRRWRRRLAKWAEERGDERGELDDRHQPFRPVIDEPRSVGGTVALTSGALDEDDDREIDEFDDDDDAIAVEVLPAERTDRPPRRRRRGETPQGLRGNPRVEQLQAAVRDLTTAIERQDERAGRQEQVLAAVAGMLERQVAQGDRLEDALGDTHGVLQRWSAPLAALAAAVETVDRGLAGLALLRGELHGVADRSESVRVTMQARVDAVGSAIGEHQATVERRIAELERRLTQDVADGTDATAKRLRHLMQTVEDMELRNDTQRQTEAERLDTVVRRIEASVQATTVDLTGIPERIDTVVTDVVTALERRVNERLARLETTSRAANEALTRAVGERADRLERTTNDAASRVYRASTELATAAGKVDSTLTEATAAVASSLEGVVTASTQALGANLEERTVRLEALLAKTSHVLEQTVEAQVTQLEAAVTKLDSSVSSTLEERLAALEQGMADALRSLMATRPHDELRETIAALRRELLG